MCREQAAEFRPHEDALREAGINLAFISTGRQHYAKDFVEKMRLKSPVLVDSDLVTYKLLQFKRAPLSVLLDPRGLPNAIRAAARGFKQGKTAGDPDQHGGVVVLERGGRPVYSFVSSAAGDMPDTSLVLQKAREAAAST